MPLPKVGVFVDVQNIYYTCKQHYNRHFNYNYFWQHITKQYQIECAYAYAIGRDDPKQQQFQNILRGIGFEVKLKPFIRRQDGSAKGDWDVGITIDMLEQGKQLDKVILLSGDGDFALLLQHLNTHYQVASEVYGVEALTADALRQSCQHYQPITPDFLL